MAAQRKETASFCSAAKEGLVAKQTRLRKALIEEALRQFDNRGFESVTVNHIVENIGISRRSFFRYFNSKDDLLFYWLDDSMNMMRPILIDRLASGHLLNATGDSFRYLARRLDRNPDRAALLARLIFSTPSLGGRCQHETMRWAGEVLHVAQEVLPALEDSQYKRQVQVTLVITAWISALRAWASSNHDRSLTGFVEIAFCMLTDGSDSRS